MSEESVTKSGEEEAVKDPQNVDPALEQDEKESDKTSDLENKILALEDRLQQQSKIIGKLTNEKKREAEPPKTDESPKGEVSKYNELKQKVDAFQERIEKQERAAKLSAIELALVDAGASAKLAKEQSEFFAFKLGERIIADETQTGVEIKITDTDGANVSVSDWAKAYLESDSGSYLRAQKKGPSVNNGSEPGRQASKVKLSSSEYSKQYVLARQKGEEEAANFTASHEIE